MTRIIKNSVSIFGEGPSGRDYFGATKSRDKIFLKNSSKKLAEQSILKSTISGYNKCTIKYIPAIF